MNHFSQPPTLRVTKSVCVVVLAALFLFVGCKNGPEPDDAMPTASEAQPHIMAKSPVDAGRYLVAIGGCNDCHTDGYLPDPDQIPEEARLLGSSMGWRGPWGTSYPRNLRLTVQDYTADEFVEMVHTRTSLPPMPWPSLNQMSDDDVKAIYAYIKSLGPAGEQPPAPVPPDQEPATPYLLLIPQNLPPQE